MGIKFYKSYLCILLAVGVYSNNAFSQERYAAIDPDAVASDQQELAAAPEAFEATPDPVVETAKPVKATAQKKSQAAEQARAAERATALDEERGISAPMTEDDVEAPKVVKRIKERRLETAPVAAEEQPEMTVKVNEKSHRKVTYESVPATQREAFIERMELARRILMKTGRAYDYRTVTLSDLRIIAKSLRM